MKTKRHPSLKLLHMFKTNGRGARGGGYILKDNRPPSMKLLQISSFGIINGEEISGEMAGPPYRQVWLATRKSYLKGKGMKEEERGGKGRRRRRGRRGDTEK